MTKKKPAALSPSSTPAKGETASAEKPAANVPLNFKVPPEFRKRFRKCAAEADIKLNELLRQALDAWEEKHGFVNGAR